MQEEVPEGAERRKRRRKSDTGHLIEAQRLDALETQVERNRTSLKIALTVLAMAVVSGLTAIIPQLTLFLIEKLKL